MAAFISYFEETGKSNTETIKRNLESKGIKTFVAHMERPNYSGNFEEKVDEVIRNCKYFILLITVGIFTRPQVIREIKTAYPKGLKDNPKLIVLRQSLYNILRSHEDFSRKTGIDIGKENQHDFKDDSELASRILILCESELNRKIEGEKIPIRNAADNHEIQEISYAELMRQVHRINSTNTDIQQSAWNRLEKL